MNASCERHQQAMLDGTVAVEHLEQCDDCRSFSVVEQTLAPPGDLVMRTVERLRPALVARSARRRDIAWGLTLAGAFSLPIIVALNAAMVWMTYAAVAQLATPQIATALASLVVGASLLALAVVYGSLPLLANWGVQLRERTT